MEGGILLPLYRYRFIRLDFETINSVVVLDYTIIILGGFHMLDSIKIGKFIMDKRKSQIGRAHV